MPNQYGDIDQLVSLLHDCPEWNVLVVAFPSVRAMDKYVKSHLTPDKTAYVDQGGKLIARQHFDIKADIFDTKGVTVSLAPNSYLEGSEAIVMRNPCFLIPNITVAELMELAEKEATPS